MSKTYIFQEIKSNTYRDFDSNDLIEVNLESFQFFEFDNQEIPSFTKTFNKGLIPRSIIKHLHELLNYYDLLDFEQEFLTLCCSFQNTYVGYFETDQDDLLTNDFIYAKKQKKQIVKALKLYDLNNKSITSIQFNPLMGNNTFKLDNWFLIKDIFNAIISYYGISNNNFDLILDDENDLDFNRATDQITYYVGNILYQFLIDKDLNQTRSFKFIDYFLRIAQVENAKKNKSGSIELYYTIEDNLNLSDGDVKALRQQFLRKRSFSI